jgi:hypothetical protein
MNFHLHGAETEFIIYISPGFNQADGLIPEVVYYTGGPPRTDTGVNRIGLVEDS